MGMTQTIEGNIVSFHSAEKANITSLKAYFKPFQTGTGIPSPSNSMPIQGWNNIKLFYTPSYIDLTPSNFTTITQDGATFSYLGNNTFDFSGGITSNGLGIEMSVSFTFKANTTYNFLIIRSPDHQMSDTLSSIGIQFKANGSNAMLLRPNGAWNNNIFSASYTFNQAYNVDILKFGIVSDNGKFTMKVIVTENVIQTQSTALENSIYGGYIDLINGKLIQTHHKVTFDGTENITSTFAGPDDNFIRVTFYSSNNSSKILLGKKLAQQNSNSCKYSHGKYEMSNTIDVSKGGVASNSSETMTLVIIHLPIELYTSSSVTSDIKAYLKDQYDNGTPVEIVYELKDPIEYQLTPSQLKTFLGENNIWSNTNDTIKITYEFNDSADILSVRKRFIVNQPHIETLSGVTSTFKTDMQAPLKSCKINFSPKQEGNTISGWSSIMLNQLVEPTIIFPANNQTIYYDSNCGGQYRLEYKGNGKFKVLDSISVSDTPRFDIEINSTVWNNANRILAISPFKNSIGAWKLVFQFKDAEKTNQIQGYFDYGSTQGVLIVSINDSTMMNGKISKYLILVMTSDIPQGTEFVFSLGDSNSTNLNTYDFSSLNNSQPIYGGYLDLTNNTVIKEWEAIDLSNLSFTYHSDAGGIMSYSGFSSTYNCKTPQYNYVLADAIAENYTITSATTTSPSSGEFFISQSGNLIIFTNEQPTGKLIFKLQNPVTYDLTCTQLKTIKNINNFWTNANGPIEIQYWTH